MIDRGHNVTPASGARRLERLLQGVTILIAALAGLLVDLPAGGVEHGLALLAAGVVAWVVTDIYGWLRLPRWLVTLLTLAGILPILNQFLGQDTFSQLMRISWLLTYWLSVIFFQEKNSRTYGSLIVLSLLLVVIAAIINSSLTFAGLLLVYQFLGILALVLLYAYSGHAALYEAFTRRHQQLVQPLQRSGERPWDTPLVAYQEPDSLPDRNHIWPRGLLWHVMGLSFSTAVFAVGFFYLVPRVGSADWRSGNNSVRSLVGLGSEVSYDERSQIYESNELAFRVAASDAATGEVYRFFEHVYFHGQTLAHYTSDSSGKTVWRSFGRSLGRPLWELPAEMPGQRVRLDFLREPTEDNTLAYVAAPFAGPGTSASLRYDRFTSRVLRPDYGDRSSKRAMRYTLYATAFRDGVQLPLVPVLYYDARSRRLLHQLPAAEKLALLEIDRARFPRLTAIAREIITHGSEADTTLYRARQLQAYFHDTKRFTYTLNFDEVARRRTPGLDPLEDFVANHRMGHCEYFAGALTLMLRSVGIPARLVIGYVGGEYNPLGKYYQVYQRNAHAWVEVYLEPHEVPEGILAQAVPPGGAAWYRLDPTPPEIIAADRGGIQLGVIDKLLDYAQLLWNTYVVEMDNSPAGDEGTEGSERFPFARSLSERLRWLRDFPRDFWQGWREAGWWNWRGGVIAALAGLVLYLFAQFCSFFPSLLKRLIRRYRWWQKRHMQLAFYRRLERMLERHGYLRGAAETQREFAFRVAERLPEPAEGNEGRRALAELVELFYAVRFGRFVVDNSVVQRTEELLATIQRALPQLRREASATNGNGRIRRPANRVPPVSGSNSGNRPA
ncbi:MAG: membrane protein [Pirellulaceae bacterium]|nr:MAG: membrane protein [Pirellulaceae bacterium]